MNNSTLLGCMGLWHLLPSARLFLVVAGRLLELETAAWKDDRRFRLLTVDNGTFSFTDLMFNTPGKPVTKGVAPPPPSLHPDNITITGMIQIHVEL